MKQINLYALYNNLNITISSGTKNGFISFSLTHFNIKICKVANSLKKTRLIRLLSQFFLSTIVMNLVILGSLLFKVNFVMSIL